MLLSLHNHHNSNSDATHFLYIAFTKVYYTKWNSKLHLIQFNNSICHFYYFSLSHHCWHHHLTGTAFSGWTHGYNFSHHIESHKTHQFFIPRNTSRFNWKTEKRTKHSTLCRKWMKHSTGTNVNISETIQQLRPRRRVHQAFTSAPNILHKNKR